jgi:uncharacterized membrane protein YfcA
VELATVAVLLLGAIGGAIVQAATGFGFAIVAAPVFLAAMNSHAALQVLVVIHLVQTVMLLPSVWTLVPMRLLKALFVGAAIGSPIGLLFFMSLDVRALKLTVGVLILLFTALLIARESGWLARLMPAGSGDPAADDAISTAPPPPLAYATGAISGAMTSLLVMPGPPLMLYLAGTPLPHAQARALAIAFFGLCYLFVTALNTFWAGMGEGVWWLVLAMVPAVYLGTLAGQRIARHVTQGSYRVAVLALLVLSGAGAIISAL